MAAILTTPLLGAPQARAAATRALVERLRRPSSYPHPVERVEVMETHISFVLLAGEFAYKIKKPVLLPFLDFSSLEARRFCCEEELRLNRRTAPQLYLEVVSIGGEPPVIGACEAPVEYAVKMRRFPQEALLDHLAWHGALEPGQVEALARNVARFHAAAARADACVERDGVERATRPALDNFDEIDALEAAPAIHAALVEMSEWTAAQRQALARRFALRHLDGYVRECHGDLHLGNVVLLDGDPAPFDCIEFNPRLRWTDVMSDVAFTVMDLTRHGLPHLATRFLNAYLEESGDYSGLRVLRFYLVYRAMVRAKIARMRMHQPGIAAADYAAAHGDFAEYLGLARRLARPAAPVLVLMHGLAGSGKTTSSQRLADALNAVRVRSDVERKRLNGLAASERSGSAPGEGLYTAASSQRTYAHLAVLAHEVLAAGFPVVVDAASLRHEDRERFRNAARAAGAAFEIVDCVAPDEVLGSRIGARERSATDASEAGLAVLALQRATDEPLTDDERRHCAVLDTATTAEWQRAADSLARRYHAPEG
jgi:aminoglycoside phosphotransferase family enzyme/predicted kinase